MSERRHGYDPDYTGPERRNHQLVAWPRQSPEDARERYIAQQFGTIERRLDSGAKRMDDIEAKLADAHEEIKRNSEITEDIREILSAGKLGLRVLGGIGQAVRWLGMLAAAAVAIYGAWQAIRGNAPKS